MFFTMVGPIYQRTRRLERAGGSVTAHASASALFKGAAVSPLVSMIHRHHTQKDRQTEVPQAPGGARLPMRSFPEVSQWSSFTLDLNASWEITVMASKAVVHPGGADRMMT